jgi:hypothetical protein
MAQRCSHCGKTERQHKGKACFVPYISSLTGMQMHPDTYQSTNVPNMGQPRETSVKPENGKKD